MRVIERLVALEKAGTLPNMWRMLDPDEKNCVWQLVSDHCTVRQAIFRAAAARRYWDVIDPSTKVIIGRYLSYDEAHWIAAQGHGEYMIRGAKII